MRPTPLTPLAAFALVALVTLSACAPPPPAALVSPPAAVSVLPPPQPAFTASAWGTFHSERFGLRLPLPEGHAWRIDDHDGPWLSATHAAEGSALLVRSWTEDGRATRSRCEERARLWLTLPDRARAEVMQDRSIDAPVGFDTQLLVATVPGKAGSGAPIAAFALAFGAHGHRCFAWAYTTSATGAGAERVVGERLAAMVERSLRKVVLENELVPRIEREPAGSPRP